MQSIHFRTASVCATLCVFAFVTGCQTHDRGSVQPGSSVKSVQGQNPNPLPAGATALAVTNQVPADAKPASSNVPGGQYPKVDAERRAYFRIVAANAKIVSVSL